MKMTLRAALLAVAMLSMVSCTSAPADPGFELRLRLVSLDPAVLDSLRLTFNPDSGQSFMMVEPMSFEDGAVNLEVAADGVVVITIAGAHVASLAESQGDGSFIFPFEVWTADETRRAPAPSVRVVGVRGSEAIAEGFLFLPEWPVPLGDSVLIPVTCLADPGSRGLCQQ